MKAGRNILIVLAIIIAIAVIGIFYLISNIESIVEAAIEKYGSEATGTDVEVSAVEIELKAGEGSLKGLGIGNPSGFSELNAVNLADITISLDTDSLTRDPIVIDKVVVSNPHIIYEINESGKANIYEIKKNIQRFQGQSAPPGENKSEKGKNILIRSLVVEAGKIDIHIAALPEKPLSAELSRIQLTNVGGEGGAAPGEIAAQVLRPIINRTVQAAAGSGIEQYLGRSVEEVKQFQESAREKLGTSAEEKAKGAEESIKKLFGR